MLNNLKSLQKLDKPVRFQLRFDHSSNLSCFKILTDFWKSCITKLLSHKQFKCQENWWISLWVVIDVLLNWKRGRGETEVMLCNIQSTLFIQCCVLHDVCLNKAQQESLKLCGRNEKYLPRMEKLTGVCSLKGSRVILFLFPFSAGIFC